MVAECCSSVLLPYLYRADEAQTAEARSPPGYLAVCTTHFAIPVIAEILMLLFIRLIAYASLLLDSAATEPY